MDEIQDATAKKLDPANGLVSGDVPDFVDRSTLPLELYRDVLRDRARSLHATVAKGHRVGLGHAAGDQSLRR
jgi:hypothetical protein